MIILIGAKGSMGRRYQAILRHLGQEFSAFDVGEDAQAIEGARRSRGVILAPPTQTHAAYCRALADCDAPILCEKPISTDLNEVREALERPAPFRMMAQYALLDPKEDGPTMYDYYRPGGDGLIWDCIQLVGLARGSLSLAQTSPIWRCALNGRALRLEEVEEAYVLSVRDWIEWPDQERRIIYDYHARAAGLAATAMERPDARIMVDEARLI